MDKYELHMLLFYFETPALEHAAKELGKDLADEQWDREEKAEMAATHNEMLHIIEGRHTPIFTKERPKEEEEDEDEHEIEDFHDGQDAFDTMMDRLWPEDA